MENNNNEIDLREEEHTPLFFKFMARAKVTDHLSPVKINFIEIDFYQTKEIVPYGHYKPISKIVTWNIEL